MRTRKSQQADWRANIMSDLPDAPVTMKATTFEGAAEIIKVAAYNRRMTVEDFIARAALAVACYDMPLDIAWEEATEKEPPMRDLRRRGMSPRRMRGKGFGPWKIEGMSE
jgi:hypothetical protein